MIRSDNRNTDGNRKRDLRQYAGGGCAYVCVENLVDELKYRVNKHNERKKDDGIKSKIVQKAAARSRRTVTAFCSV